MTKDRYYKINNLYLINLVCQKPQIAYKIKIFLLKIKTRHRSP